MLAGMETADKAGALAEIMKGVAEMGQSLADILSGLFEP